MYSSSKTMPNYKLIYFNGRGRAETIRLVFAAAGIKYEDKRIEKDAWGAMKANTPLGALPVLEVDGKQVGQSIAIARLVAKEGGLAGRNNFEQAEIDSLVDTLTEFREKGVAVMFSPEGPQKEAAAKEFGTAAASTSGSLDKFLGAKKFLVGDKLSLADIHFYGVFEGVVAKNAEAFKDHPKLKALYDRVAATPKIAEYIKKRPETAF